LLGSFINDENSKADEKKILKEIDEILSDKTVTSSISLSKVLGEQSFSRQKIVLFIFLPLVSFEYNNKSLVILSITASLGL